MITSSNVPLERVPHLWSADVKALREIGIASAGDLVRSVHENGLKSLSDSSGIPPKPLHEYLTAAEAFVREEKTRRRATVIFALALSAVTILSVSMLTVQAGLLPRSAAKAENAYADLHQQHAGAAAVDQQNLLKEVTASLEELEGEADSSRVNLLLLSSALNDRIAIAELQRAGDDPSSANYAAFYESYKAYFKKARAEQADIENIRNDDPRIAFARVNAAQAWTSRAEELGTIDLSMLPRDDPERIHIEGEIRNAQVQARREASLAGNTPNIAPALFAQRIDNVRNDLEFQAPQRLPDPPNSTEDIEKKINLMQGDLDAMQTNIEDVRARITDLQSPLADLLEQMGDQETVIVGSVDDAHVETRDLIGTVNSSLATMLNKIDEIIIVGPVVTVAGGDCGVLEPERARARETVKRQCYPRNGLTRPVTFKMGIFPSVDGVPRIVMEEGPSDNPLDCNLEKVMADFTYDNEEHHCDITFQPR